MKSAANSWMELALKQARGSLYKTFPNPAVGAVLVKRGKLISVGRTKPAGQDHAEVVAIKKAGSAAKGAELFVTLEPCHHQGKTGPCTAAIKAAGIKKVTIAVMDPNPKAAGGAAWLKRQGIKIEKNVLKADAEYLNRHFFFAQRYHRPWITLKAGISLDGRTGMIDGRSKWITSDAARKDARLLRGQCDGLVVGGVTVAADNPSLLPEKISKNPPARFVLDWRSRVSGKEKIFHDQAASKTYWITTDPSAQKLQNVTADGANLVMIRPKANLWDSLDVFTRFVGRQGIRRLWVEGGPTLLGAFLGAGLAEELYLYQSPKIFGSKNTRPVFEGVGPQGPEGLALLKKWSVKKIGDDLRWFGEL